MLLIHITNNNPFHRKTHYTSYTLQITTHFTGKLITNCKNNPLQRTNNNQLQIHKNKNKNKKHTHTHTHITKN